MIKLPRETFGPLFLPIETTQRELDSKILIATKAISNGYSVIMGMTSRVKSCALAIQRGVYFFKDHYNFRGSSLFKPLYNADIDIIALDEEGLVNPTTKFYQEKRIGNGDAFDFMQLVLAWGKKHEAKLESIAKAKKVKMCITGNLRFDLLREPFKYEYDKNKTINRNAPYVLVNTNFSAGNFAKFYNRTYLENVNKLGMINSKKDEAFFADRSKYMQNLFEHYSNCIVYLAKKLTKTNFILRPHPSEEHSTWKKEFQGLPNVHVINEGNVINWIMAAEAVIHTGCTTGIEAFVAGKPVLRYHPIYDERFESELPNSLGEGFKNANDLYVRLKEVLADKQSYKQDSKSFEMLKNHIENISGPYSYQLIMEQIDQLKYGAANGDKIQDLNLTDPFKIKFERNKMNFFRNNEALLTKLLGGDLVYKHTRRTQRFEGVSPKVVKEKMERIFELSPDMKNPGLYVKEILKGDTVLIAPKT